MPSCRNPAPLPIVFPKQERVRLSRYVVHRRVPPRAANDNRYPWSTSTWHWLLAVALAPTLTVMMLLSGLF